MGMMGNMGMMGGGAWGNGMNGGQMGINNGMGTMGNGMNMGNGRGMVPGQMGLNNGMNMNNMQNGNMGNTDPRQRFTR